MNMSDLPESFRARIAERTALPTIEKVRSLLSGYVADAENLDEVKREIQETALANTFFLRQQLVALETILSEPQAPGTLLRLVEEDANRGIDHDQTDNGAAIFLRGIAGILQEAIEEAERQR